MNRRSSSVRFPITELCAVGRTLRGVLVPPLVLLLAAGAAAAAVEAAGPSGKKHAEQSGSGAQGEQGESEKKPVWDVQSPPGEPYEAKLDVDEGTWMNLDVSPDGREIVFDLLGDLYLLPIEGGEAKSLTSGFAWDMQPRFSPDGERIAFTSDRSAGDNIWVVKRDGSDPQPVSKETFRLLNNPAWSPDGRTIAARKHFTSRRSLGSGEIWLYHASGEGEGLQLNEKPNEQKDLGEPAFSPDGRYVYFSQDTTPGGTFEYNKDPNGEIYTIRRLDRETGEIEPFITGPGGAVRPTPSPDGSSLAFVRRVRAKSVLFVHDIATSRNRALYDGLDRDLQEIWAVHGVYASFAWTPDSSAIVFWAGGKIRRVEVASGETRVIPFRVRDSRQMMEALRFPVEVAPERFHTRMLRWARVSPDGSQVVFQALGRLWLRDLPDGEARRLTTQEDHFELYPSFSRDGKSIVYTTWSDGDLGSVRLAPARPGGEGRVLVAEPGHYVEPAMSPDGAVVLYRKIPGDLLRGPLYSHDPGLYVVSTSGDGAPRRLRPDGVVPQFAAESDRVYFLVQAGPDKRLLQSVELDGSDERSHLESEAVTDIALSPDGQWVAFVERFNAWVMPFVAASKPVQIGPKATGLPLRHLSKDAGEWVHFSGASDTVYWSLGPRLFTSRLDDAFAFLASGASSAEEQAGPQEEGIDLGFDVITDVPTGTIALDGARILTMADGGRGSGADVGGGARGRDSAGASSAGIIERGTIVVRGDRIVAVGRQGEVEIPAGALRLDLEGRTVMPGIIDVHWHGSQGSDEIQPQQDWYDYATLAFGVTTIHDPSHDTSTFFAAAEMQRAGLIVAPRLFSTGTIVYGAAGDAKSEVESLDDARSHLKRLQAAGAWSVKSYNQPRRDQRQMIVAAARELGMMVVNEGGALFQHNMTMVADGHTGIEHSLPLAAVYDDVLQFWGQSHAGSTPTLIVAYGGIWGERYWYEHDDVWKNERLLTFVPREAVDPVARRRVKAPEEEYNHIAVARVTKRLHDAGVSIQLGAHGQREGLGAHWEMWMMVQGGMTPIEALHAATIDGARYLGLDRDIGSLETGKLADLVVLDDDPTQDIRNSESVHYTMVGGRLYDARSMNEIGNHPRARGPFWWEMD